MSCGASCGCESFCGTSVSRPRWASCVWVRSKRPCGGPVPDRCGTTVSRNLCVLPRSRRRKSPGRREGAAPKGVGSILRPPWWPSLRVRLTFHTTSCASFLHSNAPHHPTTQAALTGRTRPNPVRCVHAGAV
jgi:hypothetical protein